MRNLGGSGPGYWRIADVPQGGVFGESRYFFHGRGCRFRSNGVVVDYDYGAGGTIVQFDSWRLRIFGEQLPDFIEYVSLSAFHEDFAVAVSRGSIVATEFGDRRAIE